jgi:hypothetical protein
VADRCWSISCWEYVMVNTDGGSRYSWVISRIKGWGSVRGHGIQGVAVMDKGGIVWV